MLTWKDIDVLFHPQGPQSNIHDDYYPSTLKAVDTYSPPSQVSSHILPDETSTQKGHVGVQTVLV